MKVSLLLSVLLLAAGLTTNRAAADERDQRSDIYADPVVGPYEFAPARYDTTLYDRRYGRWRSAVRQAAPEDHYNQKTDPPERRPSAFGLRYPVPAAGCVLVAEARFNERANPRLRCPAGLRSAGPPPLLQEPSGVDFCCSLARP